MAQSFPEILTPESSSGFSVTFPSLPGCHSQGDTLAEALLNIQEAIELVLEDMRANGETATPAGAPLLTQVLVDA